MLDFPIIPKWWMKGNKFMKLLNGYKQPTYIIGYDTETFKGEIISQQFCSNFEKILQWVNTENVLDYFLHYISKYEGYVIVYCFNAKFDLALLLRKFINEFLNDDFHIKYSGWEIDVFCTKNWYASFKTDKCFVRFIDIYAYFKGSLDTVAKTFNIKDSKLKRPEELGYKQYTDKDHEFIEYAIRDAEICYHIGKEICKMHGEFDIPVSTSAANFAEKVFRRNFLRDGDRIKFTSFPATRLAELSYHGGKNGYYKDSPCHVSSVYEYDFNSAYGFAMYSLPSFLSGKYQKVSYLDEKYFGIYQVTGFISSCKYGILYDTRFNYFRFNQKIKVKAFVTSPELIEAINSGEFELDTIIGWVWIPDSGIRNPLHEYTRTFWELKNTTKKGDIKYLFYKLLLNSLYGKWIQRNPRQRSKIKVLQNGQMELFKSKDVSGGLYHPFIASLITGFTRAKLHQAEHYFDAIESSTDSVKSQKKMTSLVNGFGQMQLENFHCKECNKNYIKTQGIFLRNRLNLLMCPKEHILKGALHGFWGNMEKLKQLWKKKETYYEIERMPLIREGLKHENKPLFQTIAEERNINIDWRTYKEY